MATQSDQRQQWVLAALEEYEVRLTRFAERLLRDQHAAHDVVQHTFLKLCDQTPEKLDGHLALWLFRVCRNRAIDVLRETRRVETLDELDHASENDPAQTIESDELHELLRKLVAALPDNQREVVELWSQGFRYREIAEITKLTEGHVRLLNHRALTRLREHAQVRALTNDSADAELVHGRNHGKKNVFKVA